MRSEKEGHQLKALFLKNLAIQKRQPCTNCCQILTPIICLIFTIIIRNVAINNIPTQSDTVYSLLPILSNRFNDYGIIDLPELYEFIRRDKLQWFLYQCQDMQDIEYVGFRDGYGHNTGLLKNVMQTFPGRIDLNSSMHRPYTEEYVVPPAFKMPLRDVNDQLFYRYQFVNNESMYSLRHTSSIQHLPDGAVSFYKANDDQLRANLRIKDVRQFMFYRPDGLTQILMRIDTNSSFDPYFIIPEGFLSFMDMITHAYIKKSTNKSIVSGYLYMPFTEEGSVFIDMLINTIATIIFPLSLSLLLPVFLYFIVLQKQEKLIQMMRMNGMKMRNYWFISFLYNLFISLLTNIVFCGFGYYFLSSSFFHQTSPLILFIIFFGWILSQIGMSMLFQVFLSNSRAANIIGYLIAIWTNLIGATLNVALFQYPNELPVSFSLWPTFSFNRLMYLMFTNCSMDKCLSSLDAFTPEIWRCVVVLYASWILFSLLGMYLYEVIPQQYGVSQPILFPLYGLINIFSQKENKIIKHEVTGGDQLHDDTIREQKRQIRSIEDVELYPLICNKLTKVYKNGKLAVNQFNLTVQDKTIFGLLGPNGAGKTTLLSMITGIFSPTQGAAFVGGFDIKDQIDKVHLEMGVCPQFDILWPILTVEEHLYFYARLKGVNRSNERQKVEQALQEVNLTKDRNKKVSELSGGMKRRLSVGISLVGDPRIIFMDEPTTGLDPQNRRHLWQVLAKCREKRSIFLTTHLMEQAQSLCDKIGIITNGSIRTVGDQFKLKDIYGKGYYVSVSLEMEKDASVIIPNPHEGNIYNSIDREYAESVMTEQEFVRDSTQLLKHNAEKLARIKEKLLRLFPYSTINREINGLIKLHLGDMLISQILETLKMVEQDGLNFEWSISNSSLEDVFLQVITKFDLKGKPSLLDSLDQRINYD